MTKLLVVLAVVAWALVGSIFLVLEGREDWPHEGERFADTLPREEGRCRGYIESQGYCVSPEGDVYDPSFSMFCMHGPTVGVCTDENGKVDAGDAMPTDPCQNGTYSAPCSREDVERLQQGA